MLESNLVGYNVAECGYLVPPIHETGPGGV